MVRLSGSAELRYLLHVSFRFDCGACGVLMLVSFKSACGMFPFAAFLLDFMCACVT